MVLLKRPAAAPAAAAADQVVEAPKAKGKRAAEESDLASPKKQGKAEQVEEPVATPKKQGKAAKAAVPKEVDEEKLLAQQEKETVEARKKELKATPLATLKQLLEAAGLDSGKKEEMVDRLAKHEAAARKEARAQQERIRKVLVDKKTEIEGLSAPELKGRCAEEGIKGQLPKEARVEALIKVWQEDDGVDKALAKMSTDMRVLELGALEADALQQLCKKAAVDPHVKEIIVDRIVKREAAVGNFARPTLDTGLESKEAPEAGGGDMVQALMAAEAKKKRERELQRQQEEAAAQKKTDLLSKDVVQLKKLVAAKGGDSTGKKEKLVEELIRIGNQEEAKAKRKAELEAMEPAELKRFLKSKALEAGSTKKELVEAMLGYEARVQEAAVAYSSKVSALLEKKKEEWEAKTFKELKDLCEKQDLKSGPNKESASERLFEGLQASGEVDKILAVNAREARRLDLLTMDKDAVLKRCATLELNPLVKEVMVERLVQHEGEFGRVDGGRAAKRARKA